MRGNERKVQATNKWQVYYKKKNSNAKYFENGNTGPNGGQVGACSAEPSSSSDQE